MSMLEVTVYDCSRILSDESGEYDEKSAKKKTSDSERRTN